LPAREGDWLAVGTLVASKPTWPASWSVGVIRRLSTDEMGRRAVGVQILARGGVAVEINALPITETSRPRLGVLLPAEAQTHASGGEVTLLLARGCVSWSAAYTMRVHGRTYTLAPLRISESGEEFDIIQFSIQSGAAS
jgi:hypothetical protein